MPSVNSIYSTSIMSWKKLPTLSILFLLLQFRSSSPPSDKNNSLTSLPFQSILYLLTNIALNTHSLDSDFSVPDLGGGEAQWLPPIFNSWITLLPQSPIQWPIRTVPSLAPIMVHSFIIKFTVYSFICLHFLLDYRLLEGTVQFDFILSRDNFELVNWTEF